MMFFKKKPYPHPQSLEGEIRYEKKGRGGVVSLSEFEKISGALFIPDLDFSDGDVYLAIKSKIKRLYARGELSREQVWFGSYFRNEIISHYIPPISIRWIDDDIGWGVFAEKDLKKMDFVAEYSGLVRKWRRADKKNGYCFEYVYASGVPSSYTIDAQDQSGIARFINHSSKANLDGSVATFDGLSHVVLYAKAPIAKGTQLTYDYGPSYWSRRETPKVL